MKIFGTKLIPSGFHVYFLGDSFLEVELLCQRAGYTNFEVFGTYYQIILSDNLDTFLFYSGFSHPH